MCLNFSSPPHSTLPPLPKLAQKRQREFKGLEDMLVLIYPIPMNKLAVS
jgi:hypothetical protein